MRVGSVYRAVLVKMIAFFVLCVFAAVQLVQAKTVTYNWDIEWVTAAPDGFARPVIGINGEWPCPTIDVNNGDTVVVNVYNGLGNQSTGLHWHGIHQNGTNYMDGTTGATQCPIPPGSSFQYKFLVSSQSVRASRETASTKLVDRLTNPELTGITRTI